MGASPVKILIFLALLVPHTGWGDISEIQQLETQPLYREIADVEIALPGNRRARLSEFWNDKPLLITLFYKNCSGACRPFLRSLKSAVDEVKGLGKDYRILSLSFDPKDTVETVNKFARALDIEETQDWLFGTAASADIEQIAQAIGFWYKLEPKTNQYDHPTMLAAVRRAKIVRVLLGTAVSKPRFKEMAAELNGRFVPFYSHPDKKTLFRCLQFNETTQEVWPGWGLAILLLPAGIAISVTTLLFTKRKRRIT